VPGLPKFPNVLRSVASELCDVLYELILFWAERKRKRSGSLINKTGMRFVFEYEKYESMKKRWMEERKLKMKC
jgi:hypothetical protein